MVCGGWKVAGLGGCGGRVLDSNSSTSLPGGNQVDGLPPASSMGISVTRRALIRSSRA